MRNEVTRPRRGCLETVSPSLRPSLKIGGKHQQRGSGGPDDGNPGSAGGLHYPGAFRGGGGCRGVGGQAQQIPAAWGTPKRNPMIAHAMGLRSAPRAGSCVGDEYDFEGAFHNGFSYGPGVPGGCPVPPRPLPCSTFAASSAQSAGVHQWDAPCGGCAGRPSTPAHTLSLTLSRCARRSGIAAWDWNVHHRLLHRGSGLGEGTAARGRRQLALCRGERRRARPRYVS